MITTVTLNASIDKAYHMNDEIVNGTVMRVRTCRNSAGGKGLNVARVVKICGSDVKATGLIGGFNGQYLESLLDNDGISHEFGHVNGETRSCINILDPEYGSTEYLEPGFVVNSEEIEQYLKNFKNIISDSDVVTISGSVPAGLEKDIYQKMVDIVKEEGKQVILDTSGELLQLGIHAKPTMVKPNQDEIEALFDMKIDSRQDVIDAAGKIYDMGIPYVVISLGGDGALIVCDAGIYQATPPKMDVVNTVGCGDSMVGAFAVAMEQKKSPEEAIAFAVAVASANAMSPNTGDFDPELRNEILSKVKIQKIG